MSEATPSQTPPQPAPHGRAGRNLVAAAGMGLLLGFGVVLLPVLYAPWLFSFVIATAMAVAAWEIAGAMDQRGIHVERWVLYLGTFAMPLAGYWYGVLALLGVFGATVLAVFGARLLREPAGYVADVSGSVMIAAYTGLLGGFGGLVLASSQGGDRVIVVVALAICSDVGGYVFGVLWGKHPMAPRVSPKKSWEGFAGSLVFGMVAGVALFVLLLEAPWWQGLVMGVVLTAVATAGDFAESAIKRDLGVKDMSKLIAGHGGLMDRLDSILPNIFAGWLLLLIFLGP